MKSYLVTGGCGFIGVNLVSRLVAQGGHVRVLDNLSLGKREYVEPFGVEVVVGDVRDPAAVAQAVEGMETVIHLAAHTRVIDSISDPQLNFEINARGTLNVLQASRDAGIRTFIFASTGGAILGEQAPPVHEEMVPRPISPYGASKLAGEAYCSAFYGSFGLNTVALRFSNVYGPHSYHKGSVVAHFIKQALQGEPLVIFGDGEQTRDFLYVEDLADAICACATGELDDVAGQVFQMGSGRETKINVVASAIQSLAAKEGFKVPISLQPARKGEIFRNYADIGKAKKALGYSPRTGLNEGIIATWDWFRSNGTGSSGRLTH